jgi:hypothetical protein
MFVQLSLQQNGATLQTQLSQAQPSQPGDGCALHIWSHEPQSDAQL